MIKAVVSRDESSHQIELEGPRQESLVGKRIGDSVDGEDVGLPGYTLEVRGGSDSDGFPMRRDLDGTARRKVLLSGGEGFNPSRPGERRRKTVRGNSVSGDTVQVNLVVTEAGERPLQELIEES